jgi:hypothetical protein
MKDTYHRLVHFSVHLRGERKSCGAQRMRTARHSDLGAGKTPDWAGATPVFGRLAAQNPSRGRSSPVLMKVPVDRVLPAPEVGNKPGKE